MKPKSRYLIRLAVLATISAATSQAQITSTGTTAGTNWTGAGTWTSGPGAGLTGYGGYPGQVAPDRQDGFPPGIFLTPNGSTINTTHSPVQTQIEGGGILDINATSFHASQQIGYTLAGGYAYAGGGGTGYVDTPDTLDLGQNGLGSGTLNLTTGAMLEVGMSNGGVFLAGSGIVQDGTFFPNRGSDDRTTSPGSNGVMPNGGVNGYNQSQQAADYSVLAVGQGSAPGMYRDQTAWHAQNNPNRQFDLPADPAGNPIDPAFYQPSNLAQGGQQPGPRGTNQAMPLYEAGGFFNIGDDDIVHASGTIVSHQSPLTPGISTNGQTSTLKGQFNMDGGVLNVVQYGWGWNGVEQKNWHFANGTDNQSRFEGWELDNETGAYGVNGSAAGDAREDSRVDGAVTDIGGNYMYVDPKLYTRGNPGGNSTAPFPDPGGTSWRQTDNNNQNLDPFDIANNPNLDPFYLQIARSGGNIRVGNNNESSGEFNISNGMVTTNNLEVGRFRDAYGVVNQVGGDIYIREDVSLAGRTGGNSNTGIYNLGDDGANNVSDSDNQTGRTQFNNDNSAVSGTYFGQYYGRTATGGALSDWDNINQDFGTDGNNTGATGHTTLLTSQYDAGTFMTPLDTGTYAQAPTPEAAAPIGGGILEIARDLLVGQRGLGIFNMNLAETWTDENGVVRDSFFVVGDDILLASSENNAVGIFNYDSTVDILASNRQWRFDIDQRIIIGDNANDGSNALGIFNYNPGSGLIGNDTTGAASGDSTAAPGVNPRFDRIQVGEGRHSTGYFNHNNENVVSLDNEIEIGDQSDSFGILNLLGDPTTQQGGIHADDGIVVGEAGTGVLNQTGQTTVEAWEAGFNTGASFNQERDIVIAQYHESTDEGNNSGTAADAERAGNLSGQGRRSYGEYNFGLPSKAELTAGQVVGGTFAQKEGYHDQGTDDTPSIRVNDLRIGEGGDGSFNHYANSDLTTTASNGGPGDIDIGGQNYGVGEYNLVNNTGVTVTAADDIEIGEAGKGTFNQGMYAAVAGPDGLGYNQLDPANPASKLPDGVIAGTGYTPDTYDPNAAGANSMVVATGDIIVGGSTAYESRNEEGQAYTTIIRDSGEGHYNLNATGADIQYGGALRIGTGDNVQEGIMYRDDNGDGAFYGPIDGDVGGLANEIENSRQAETRNQTIGGVATPGPRDARIPWMNAAGTDFLAWDGQSASVDPATGLTLAGNNANVEGAPFNTALQGTAFGTGAMWQDQNDTEYNMVAGAADGHGSIGTFNHNNDTNFTNFAPGTFTLGDGDNAQGFYNQNGTGDVIAAGDIEMSVDRYDAGDATIAPSAAVVSAGGNGTGYDALEGGYNTNGGFEMGQSTWTVNNTSAILDLAGNNVVGDSIDVAGGGGVTTAAGGGGQIPDHMAGGAMQMKDNPQATGTQWALINRDNEAQINLFEGEIRNTRDVNADIYQFGGHFDMGQSASAAVTTDLSANDHDFIQMETNTPYTNPLTWDMADISADGDVNPNSGKPGPTIEFNWFGVDGNLDSGAPSGVGTNTGTNVTDTLIADHIQLNADPGSIQIDLSGMPAGYFTSLTRANNGDYWNLLDWTDDFTWGVGGGLLEPGTGGLSNDTDITDNANDLMAFDFGLGMGVLPTLTALNGQQFWWSIDPNGPGGIEGNNVNTPGATDIFQTRGILYIYTVPEPSRAMLLLGGAMAMILRRKRS